METTVREKSKMLIFHWFYKVFGDTKRVPRAKMLKNYWFLKQKVRLDPD